MQEKYELWTRLTYFWHKNGKKTSLNFIFCIRAKSRDPGSRVPGRGSQGPGPESQGNRSKVSESKVQSQDSNTEAFSSDNDESFSDASDKDLTEARLQQECKREETPLKRTVWTRRGARTVRTRGGSKVMQNVKIKKDLQRRMNWKNNGKKEITNQQHHHLLEISKSMLISQRNIWHFWSLISLT